MINRGNQKPRLKVSYNDKIKNDFEYCKEWMEYIYSSSVFSGSKKDDLLVYYDLANNTMSDNVKKFFKRVTNPYNFEKEKHQNFPAKIELYNIVSPILNFLWGDKLSRPFNYIVTSLGSGVDSRYLEERKQKINDLTQMVIEEDMTEEEFVEEMNQFELSYKDKLALMAQDTLEYIVTTDRVRETFQDMFKHFTIAGESYSYSYVHHEEVKTKSRSIFSIDYCRDGESEYVEDADWVICVNYWTPSRILDEFYHLLSDDQVERLSNSDGHPFYNVFSEHYQHVRNISMAEYMNRDRLEVVHCQWRCFKKIGVFTYIDPITLQEEKMEVPEDFNPEGLGIDGELDFYWINEVWEGYRIDGGDTGVAQSNLATQNAGFYIGFKPIDYQRSEINNLAECKLSYNGKKYSNFHTEQNSIVKMLMPWQILYIIVMYRLEQAIAKSKGQVAMMFVESIPNGSGAEDWNVDDFLYYNEALGIGLLSYAQMVELGMRDGMNNLVSKVDMNQLDAAGFYINMLAFIQEQARESLGITRQRLGSTTPSDKVGAVHASISQSSNSTEMLYYEFENLESRILNQLLDLSKFAFVNGKKAQFVRDDYSLATLNLDYEKFIQSDYAVYVIKSATESQNLQMLKEAGVNLASQGNRPSTVAQIIEANNYKKIKEILLKIEEEDMKRAEQQSQNEQEAQQAQIKIQQEMAQILETIKTEGQINVDTNRINLEKEKDIAVETVRGEYQALRNVMTNPEDMDGDGAISEAEMAAFIQKRQELVQAARDKAMDRSLKAVDIKSKQMQKQQEINFKEKELEAKERMNTENNKTMLKNKVAGEK